MNQSPIRLAILQTHPIQYWVPLYKALAETSFLSVNVYYLTDSGAKPYHDSGFGQIVSWDIPLFDGYDFQILKNNIDLSTLSFWSRGDSRLHSFLSSFMPNWILVDGYASRMNLSAVTWAMLHDARIAYTSDSNIHVKKSSLAPGLKELYVTQFFKRVSAFFSPSLSNQCYLERFGADKSKIHRYPYSIDYSRFKRKPCATYEFEFLWAGKLTERKRPLDFIHALNALVHKGYSDIRACVIGGGEMESLVRTSGADLVSNGVLEIKGFVNQSKMPLELSKGQVFVFTSENEPYGLVATEAAANGAALVVAEGIGCIGPDSSAQPGVNTVTYPMGNVEALANAMELLLTDHDLRSRMQEQSVVIAKKHDVSMAASVISSVLSSSCLIPALSPHLLPK
jgi:glycosyltransferase involved in cell wall biosynthesis